MLTTNTIASAMYGKGKMTTGEIYVAVKKLTSQYGIKLSPNWRSTVRNNMQRHCRKHHKFVKPNLFVHHGRGLWECKRK